MVCVCVLIPLLTFDLRLTGVLIYILRAQVERRCTMSNGTTRNIFFISSDDTPIRVFFINKGL